MGVLNLENLFYSFPKINSWTETSGFPFWMRFLFNRAILDRRADKTKSFLRSTLADAPRDLCFLAAFDLKGTHHSPPAKCFCFWLYLYKTACVPMRARFTGTCLALDFLDFRFDTFGFDAFGSGECVSFLDSVQMQTCMSKWKISDVYVLHVRSNSLGVIFWSIFRDAARICASVIGIFARWY